MSSHCHFPGEKFTELSRKAPFHSAFLPQCIWLIWDRPSHTSSCNRHNFHLILLPIQNDAYRPPSILLKTRACHLRDVNMWTVTFLPKDKEDRAPHQHWHRGTGEDHRERKPSRPVSRTCHVVLLHTDVEFLLRKLGCVIIHISDPNVENQGIIQELSCKAIHDVKVNLRSRERSWCCGIVYLMARYVLMSSHVLRPLLHELQSFWGQRPHCCPSPHDPGTEHSAGTDEALRKY